MAQDNDSPGPKILVGALIPLTVILAVTAYFLYARAAQAEARFAAARDAQAMSRRTANLALTHYDELRSRIGTKASEFDAAREEISAHFKKVDDRLNNLMNAVNAAVQSAEQNGARGPELANAKRDVQNAIASYCSQPQMTYIAALDRLTELTENLTVLMTRLATKGTGVRTSAEGAADADARGKNDQGPKTKD